MGVSTGATAAAAAAATAVVPLPRPELHLDSWLADHGKKVYQTEGNVAIGFYPAFTAAVVTPDMQRFGCSTQDMGRQVEEADAVQNLGADGSRSRYCVSALDYGVKAIEMDGPFHASVHLEYVNPEAVKGGIMPNIPP